VSGNWKVHRGETQAHEHSSEEEHRIREAALDETIEETFPASDPLSTIPNPDDEEALKRAS
jgi:hypothetical protein